MSDKPGFTVDEITATYNAGGHIAAIKMLRAETGCSLHEAITALRDAALEQMPTFKEFRARRRAERAGPRLHDLLTRIVITVDYMRGADKDEREKAQNLLIETRAILDEIEKE